MRKPTESQTQLIRFFAGGAKPTARITRQTYARCEAEGWIVPIEEVFPYHEVTEAGREAIGLPIEHDPAEDAAPVDVEFWFMSGEQDENGTVLQSRMWARNGNVFLYTKGRRFGKSELDEIVVGLSRIEATAYVYNFCQLTLAAAHSDALRMDRARIISYRFPCQGGTGERTLYVDGDQIFQFGTDIEPAELYVAMGSPEMAMQTMVAIRANVMEQAHTEALAEARDRTLSYRSKESDGSWIERTIYVQGGALMETVSGRPEPRVYARYDSPETAMIILSKAKERILNAIHVSALAQDRDRNLVAGLASASGEVANDVVRFVFDMKD